MKKITFAFVFFLFLSFQSYCQFSVDYHQSNLPFIAMGYDLDTRFKPELRFGADSFIEDLQVEAFMTYKFFRKEDYSFYAGLGYKANVYEGLVVPIGFNFYPFTEKKFGFHIETTPIFLDSVILRGSFGIHYRFL